MYSARLVKRRVLSDRVVMKIGLSAKKLYFDRGIRGEQIRAFV